MIDKAKFNLPLAQARRSRQGHDQLRGNRRNHVFQHHGGEDAQVAPLGDPLLHDGIEGVQHWGGSGNDGEFWPPSGLA